MYFGKKFFFPVEVSATIDIGMAWCPAYRYSGTQFDIIVSAYDQTGQLAVQKTVTFSGPEAQFINQLLRTLPKPFRGHIYLESMQYFYLEILRLEQTAGGSNSLARRRIPMCLDRALGLLHPGWIRVAPTEVYQNHNKIT